MATVLGRLPEFLNERPEGVVRVRGMKLLLEGVIYLHRDGIAPERMVESYPDLDVGVAAQIVDYYQENREAVDGYVAQVEREWQKARIENEDWLASRGMEPTRVIIAQRKREAERQAKGSTTNRVEEVVT